jgi:hypothetical protein
VPRSCAHGSSTLSYRFHRRRPHEAQDVAPSASATKQPKQYSGVRFLHFTHVRERSSGFAA